MATKYRLCISQSFVGLPNILVVDQSAKLSVVVFRRHECQADIYFYICSRHENGAEWILTAANKIKNITAFKHLDSLINADG